MASSQATCDVCLQEYDTLKRIPKFLSCFHTFCLLCLQSRVTNGIAIICPTCSNETTIKCQPLDKGLQSNFYIMNQLEGSSTPATGTEPSEVEVKRERYYWCSSCNQPVKEGETSHEKHELHDMETDDGREMAEVHLKTLFVTCKSTWNGALSKRRESESALKSAHIALQALEQQVNNRHKENERHMKTLQKYLSEVGAHLGKSEDAKQQSGEEIHKLFQRYKQLMTYSKDKKPTNFEAVRNAIASMEIKSSGGEKLTIPMFNSALLNIPAEGASEQQSHILTTLSILIIMATQQEQWTAQVRPSDSLESKKKTGQPKANVEEGKVAEAVRKDSKTESARKDSKTEPARKDSRVRVAGKETEPGLKPGGGATPDGKGARPKFHPPPVVKSNNHRPIPIPNPTDPARKMHAANNVAPHRRENIPSLGLLNTPHQGNFRVPPPVMMPPLMSLHNKKAFFVLAVNGKQYGNIVIEIRPDVAPVMSQRFAQSCLAKDATSYQNTIIYQSKPKTYIMGGRLPGPEILYMADPSPLKKTRGAIFFRLKRDYAKTQCSIVSTEFCIHLDEETPENFRTSTVFGYVCDGLAVCDAISHMDCIKDHVAVSSAGIVG